MLYWQDMKILLNKFLLNLEVLRNEMNLAQTVPLPSDSSLPYFHVSKSARLML